MSPMLYLRNNYTDRIQRLVTLFFYQKMKNNARIAAILLSVIIGASCADVGSARTISMPAGQMRASLPQFDLTTQSSLESSSSGSLHISVDVSATPTSGTIPGSVFGLSYTRSHQLTFFSPTNTNLVPRPINFSGYLPHLFRLLVVAGVLKTRCVSTAPGA